MFMIFAPMNAKKGHWMLYPVPEPSIPYPYSEPFAQLKPVLLSDFFVAR